MTRSNPRPPLGLIYAAVTAISIWFFVVVWTMTDIVRVDFIGTYPNRSQMNAIFIALVEGPIVGVAIVFLGVSLCVAAATITAKATEFLLDKVPLWMLPINALVCGAAIYIQVRCGFFNPVDAGPLIPGTFHPLRIARGYLYLFITLLSAWWLTRPAVPPGRI